MDTNNKTFKLTFSGIMIALATALSFISVYKLPLGGCVTLFSMLPICFIGIMYGVKFAILPSVIYGFIQFFLGGALGFGLTPAVLLACIGFDYILAFGVLCFSGIFRKKGEKGAVLGIISACVLRFLSHFISGFVLWTNVEMFELFGKSFVNHPIIYSAVYNGSYMLPEMVLTVIGAVLLMKIPFVHSLMNGKIQAD